MVWSAKIRGKKSVFGVFSYFVCTKLFNSNFVAAKELIFKQSAVTQDSFSPNLNCDGIENSQHKHYTVIQTQKKSD